MGICASCLGLTSSREQSDSASESQNLLSDPYQNTYGTGLNADGRQAYHIDAEEIQRQREALERLCMQTSDKLIDISAPKATMQKEGSKMSAAGEGVLVSSAAHTMPVVETSKITMDYPRLFAERFGPFLRDHAAHIQPPSSSPQASSLELTRTESARNDLTRTESAKGSAPTAASAKASAENSKRPASRDDVVAWLSERLGKDLRGSIEWKVDGVKEPLSFGIQDAMPA